MYLYYPNKSHLIIYLILYPFFFFQTLYVQIAAQEISDITIQTCKYILIVLSKRSSYFIVLRLVYICAIVMICSDFRGTAPAPGIMNTPTSDPTLRYHPASNLGPHDSQVHTRLVCLFEIKMRFNHADLIIKKSLVIKPYKF